MGECERASEFDGEYKVIVIGDAAAGKSCFFHQFLEKRYRAQSLTTIGAEFGAKTLTLQDQRVKLNVWDTAGQERYRAVTRAYFRGALGALILYDITSEASYGHLAEWLQDAQDQASEDIVIMIVGNKCDLADQRKVTFDRANTWAQDHNLMFLETSALTGENVQEVFHILATQIHAKASVAKDRALYAAAANDGVSLERDAGAPSKKGRCCE
eukprot:TRINITY_DN31851_c0_g1_i1.p1 TRINITY_DN31851_c0_g1~~TRINITY_DN31851_c0_g1_i1.p1  ORF type:complete len:213 (-),score=38.19 TRINITY_DN31851_c0_g1_i1:97-735(-)